MSASITYPYVEPSNYTYDSDYVEVTGGVATLKMQTDDLDFVEDFADDTDFTYDSAKAEFSGGKVQQIDKTITDAIFYASFTSTKNGSWGEGTMTATGTADVSGGQLDCTTGNAYIEWPVNNLASITDKGCVRFRYRPNYTGGAPSTQYLLQTSPSSVSRVYIAHAGTTLQVYITDNVTSIIFSMLYTWSVTANQLYEVEVDWDATGGNAYLYIDGVKVKNDTGTGTMASPSLFRMGQGSNAAFKLADILVFDTVQHTGSTYTPDWSDLTETKFLANNVTLPEMAHVGVGTIEAFNSLTTTEGGTPRYTLQIGRSGDYLYWDGDSWEISNGSWAQANTAATFTAQGGSIPVVGEEYGQFKVHFPASNTQSYVDELIANLNVDIGYTTDAKTIYFNSTFRTSELLSFSETATTPANTAVKYTVEVDGQEKYWNGAAVVDSNGTYAQSSTQSDINTNIADFVTSGRPLVRAVAYLYTSDDQVRPQLDLNAVTYNIGLPDPTLPTLVDFDGFIYDMNGPVSGLKIYARPYKYGYITEGVFQKYDYDELGTTDSDGYFDVEIYATKTGEYIDLKIGKQSYKTTIPDQAEVDLKDLTLTLIEDE